MIKGIGTDIIEIDRVKKAIEKESFLKKYFTEAEQALIKEKGPQTAAGNFAAKEAAVKALKTGFGKIMPKEIEVLRQENGAPSLLLSGSALKEAERQNIHTLFVTLSHNKTMAQAFVVAEEECL